jgi:hypothetical protein
MSYRVKDYWKNTISELDSLEELREYISSNQVTHSVDFGYELQFNYFEYDYNLHENMYEQFGDDSGSLKMVRILYSPGQDDIEDEIL